MDNTPRITIITVVYNGAEHIRRTIESVINQTVSPYEYIVIDGNSTDDTVSIAREYKKQIERKGIIYRIISEPDKGIYDAMNKGVCLAKGDYIAFINSDDWYFNNAIETVYKTYDQKKFDMAYGSIQYMSGNKALLIKKSKVDKFVSSRNWNHPSTFVKRDLYYKYPFDLSYRVYSDFNWFLHMRRLGLSIAIFPDDKPIAHFSAGGASINSSIKNALKRAKEKYRAYRGNGYSRIYLAESYGWELIKFIFAATVK